MEKLKYGQSVVVIIFGAMGALLFGYALWYLWTSRKIWEQEGLKEMSPEQKKYIYLVRDRNRRDLAAPIGVLLYPQ